jgi:two-component system nitrogen regulation sensor histidine kinase NtrY
MSSGCEAIIAQVTGLKELVDAFRQYARMPGVNPRPASLSRIVREVASLYEGMRDELEVVPSIPDEEIRAVVDAVLLRQALVNLLDNAADAVSGDGTISLTLAVDGTDVVIEVADTGVGLPTEDAEMLLQPFFSTKGRGSGMGLALVHRIVTDHGGVLELENRSPAGALVRIILRECLVDDNSAAGGAGPDANGIAAGTPALANGCDEAR